MGNDILKSVRNIYCKLKRRIELGRYNDFTIAEYFRNQGATIGTNNRLEIRSLGTEPFLVSIGNHCTIAPNVQFLTHDGAVWIFTDQIPSLQKFGSIVILDNCFIGMNSMIMGNIKIGPNSIVGACSVVTKDVPPGIIVAGNPAKPISTISNYKNKVLPIWERQKPERYFNGLTDGVIYSPEYIQQKKNRDSRLLRDHLIKHFKMGNR